MCVRIGGSYSAWVSAGGGVPAGFSGEQVRCPQSSGLGVVPGGCEQACYRNTISILVSIFVGKLSVNQLVY